MKRRKFFVIIALAIIAVLSIVYAVLFLSGRGAWLAVKAKLEAKGERLSLSGIKPPPIPEADNFYAIPLFQEPYSSGSNPKPNSRAGRLDACAKRLWALGIPVDRKGKPVDWTAPETIVKFKEAIAPVLPILEEVRQARPRPLANSGLDWEKGLGMDLPALSRMADLRKILLAHGALATAERDGAAAVDDIETLLRLTKAGFQESEAFLNMVGSLCGLVTLDFIARGLEQDLWTDGQLVQIDRALAQVPPAALAFASGLRTYRAQLNDYFLPAIQDPWKRERLGSLMRCACTDSASPIELVYFPSVLLYEDLAFSNQLFQQQIEAIETLSIPPPYHAHDWNRRISSYATITFDSSALSAFRFEAYMRMARLAVALERHQLQKGAFPETLAALSSEFMPTLPLDPVSGNPFFYRRLDERRFQLWSVGWDRVDNGGTPSTRFKKSEDWVWYKSPEGGK